MLCTVTSATPGPLPTADSASRVADGAASVAFGKYRLHYRIARGGMGEVYRASLVGELGFEKPLVIKTILPELAAQSRFIKLFAAEAKTAVALSHGNIVPIYELGRAGDTFYIVMGYVDGPSVAQLLTTYKEQEIQPPLAIALSIIRGVLSGLAYAHSEQGGRRAVVHRDITPRNVMLDRSGQVRIVDFGIATPAHARTGVRAGSIGYVAPEQARAEAADPRADVFSTACLLYELVTLERAFPHKGVWTSPSLQRAPEALREPLRAALALDPAKRPADAGAFLSSLGAAITQHAATVSESDLADHLRRLYPDGQWSPPPALGPGGVTPSTVVRPSTTTFATRLTSLSESSEVLEDSGFAIKRPTADPLDRRPVDPPTHGPTNERSGRSRHRSIIALGTLLGMGLFAWMVWPLVASDAKAPASPAVKPSSIESNPVIESPPSQVPTGPDPLTSEAAITSSLAPALVLFVSPSDATVRIGSQRFEGDSPFTLPLPTHGALEATVEHAGYEPQTVELRAGEPGEQVIELVPTVRGRGYLQVLAPGVSWAEITVDGRQKGMTPGKIELNAGPHRVVVRCLPDVCGESKILLRRAVDIEPNETARVIAR